MSGGDGKGDAHGACEVVRANTSDLAAYVEAGASFSSLLRATFDWVVDARGGVGAELGLAELPLPRAARLDGGPDPFGELLADAMLANAFVDEVARALGAGGATGDLVLVPADQVRRALLLAELDVVGREQSAAEDQELLARLAIRRGFIDLFDESAAPGLPDHLRVNHFGLALDQHLASIDDDPTLVGQVLVELGIDYRTATSLNEPDGAANPDDLESAGGSMLVMQGLHRLPPEAKAALLDELAANDHTKPRFDALVDALDLNDTVAVFDTWGNLEDDWAAPMRRTERHRLVVDLLQASFRPDGSLSLGGQRLANRVLDHHADIVESSDRVAHHGDGPDVRAALAAALAAPNSGLAPDQWRDAEALDAIDRRLVASTPGGAEFEELWFERRVLVARLTRNDPEVGQLFGQGSRQGMAAADAIRLARFAVVGGADGGGSLDDRVRRLRVVYETDAWGEAVDIERLTLLRSTTDVAEVLRTELSVLQAVQLARFAETELEATGREMAPAPLSAEQVDLVRAYAEVAPWFFHRFAGAFPGDTREAMEYLAELGPDGRAAALGDTPPGFDELVDRLIDPENRLVWELMAGAAGNDRFLGPDGAFRGPNGHGRVTSADPGALLVQLALASVVGPHQRSIDTDGDGVLHEGEVDSWLEAADRLGSGVPPALVDRVRLGRGHGLGHDTFGWDEIGELAGWGALTLAIAASIVWSGGAATPLWVQGGVVGLSATEIVALHQAGDEPAAAMSALLGIGELGQVGRALRGLRLGLDDVEVVADAHRRLVLEAASELDSPAIRSVLADADELTDTQLVERLDAVIASERLRLASDLLEQGLPPQQVSDALSDLAGGPQRWVSRDRPVPKKSDGGAKEEAVELEGQTIDLLEGRGADVWVVDDSRRYNPDVPETWLFDDNGQMPPDPAKNPDLIVDGEFVDVTAPTTPNPVSVLKNARTKVTGGQSRRVTINLDRSEHTLQDIEAAMDTLINEAFDRDEGRFLDDFSYKPGDGTGGVYPLEELAVVHQGEMITLWPRPGR